MDAHLLLAIFATALLSGVFGMAGGLVLLALLTLRLPIEDAMVVHGAAQLVANGSRALISGRYVRGRILLGFALGALIAVTLAVLMRLRVATWSALLLTGSAPFLEPMYKRLRAPEIDRPKGAVVCGGIATTLHLVAGTAGPLLDVMFLRTPMARHELVATKAAAQVLGHATKVLFFLWLAPNTATALELSADDWALMSTASVAGTFAGRQVLDRLSEEAFRRYSRALVYTVGGTCIVQGLVAFTNR